MHALETHLRYAQRNLKTVMHAIYNWLLNKHICIIILERLFVYQIKSTCNKRCSLCTLYNLIDDSVIMTFLPSNIIILVATLFIWNESLGPQN
jgi:hypothetical protein